MMEPDVSQSRSVGIVRGEPLGLSVDILERVNNRPMSFSMFFEFVRMEFSIRRFPIEEYLVGP